MTQVHANIDSARGFAEPVLVSQSTFRSLMNAVARPGSIQTIESVADVPSLLMPAAAAVALALFDHDTAVWIDPVLSIETGIADWLRFQTGAPLTTDASLAAFALVSSGSELPEFSSFAQGTPEYPDRSTTLIVQVDTLMQGTELALSGPGIRGTSPLRAGVLPSDFLDRIQTNHAQFPQGVDLVLVCGLQLVALPRSTQVTAREA